MIVDWIILLFLAEPVPRADSSYRRVYDGGVLGYRWYCACGQVLAWRHERCSCGGRR